MTEGKQGKKEESGNAVPSKPECFGYFMSPIHGFKQCATCVFAMECYTKWKDLGEPTKALKNVCPVKWGAGRCKECEGI